MVLATFTKVKDRLRQKYNPFYRNTVWGHIIYRPIQRVRWEIPAGMTTLDQFLEWHQDRFNITHRSGGHPLALEVYFSITMPRELTKREIAVITADLIEALIDNLFGNITELMEWGFDVRKVDYYESTESKIRYSRDGENFVEIDISDRMRRTVVRLGLE